MRVLNHRPGPNRYQDRRSRPRLCKGASSTLKRGFADDRFVLPGTCRLVIALVDERLASADAAADERFSRIPIVRIVELPVDDRRALPMHDAR
jgi:hypothetical protein